MAQTVTSLTEELIVPHADFGNGSCSSFTALLLAAGLCWGAVSQASAATIDVPAGDSDAFLAAVRAAHESEGLSIIRLNNGAEYRLDPSTSAPRPISTHIIIQGNGAHLVGAGDESYGPLFTVLDEGTLELSDLTIRDFRGTAGPLVQDGSLIKNSGVLLGRNLRIEHIHVNTNGYALSGVFTNRRQLDLSQVRIVDITVENTGDVQTIALYNRGGARLENVLIVDGKGQGRSNSNSVPIYIHSLGPASLDLRFSSLILESEPSATPPDAFAILDSTVGFTFTPETTISGSIVVGMKCGFGSPASSGGFNLFTSRRCDLGGDNDLVGVSPGTLEFPIGMEGGIEVRLPPGSRALDGVVDPAFTCPGSDAVGNFRPQDGDNDGIARCDIGAFENEAGRPLLAGGANGLFYSAESDGHYVTIQEVRPDEYVIFWNTFDLNGNQAWVLGVGERVADVISAQGYFQPSGMLVPGGGAEVDTSELQEWGNIEIELADCFAGTFAYASGLPRFGSGSFNLDRLGFVEGLGCQNN